MLRIVKEWGRLQRQLLTGNRQSIKAVKLPIFDRLAMLRTLVTQYLETSKGDPMIVVRDVFQARYGKGDELVALLKEANKMWSGGRNARLLTDLSGPFFTVVNEAEYDNFSMWEAALQKEFADHRFAEWFERMMSLVESGRREFYHRVP